MLVLIMLMLISMCVYDNADPDADDDGVVVNVDALLM